MPWTLTPGNLDTVRLSRWPNLDGARAGCKSWVRREGRHSVRGGGLRLSKEGWCVVIYLSVYNGARGGSTMSDDVGFRCEAQGYIEDMIRVQELKKRRGEEEGS